MRPVAYNALQRNGLLDEFITPIELVEACVKQVLVPKFPPDHPLQVCDVGARDGRWGKTVKKYFPNALVTGVELMLVSHPKEFTHWVNADFMGLEDFGPFEVCIGNPPFTVKEYVLDENGYIVYEDNKPKKRIVYKAEDFVRKALSLTLDYGYTMFLLRSNFRHSLERKELFKEHMYKESYNFTLRPSYYKEDKREEAYGTKQTNAHDNAFFVFQPSWKMPYAIERVLDWQYAV